MAIYTFGSGTLWAARSDVADATPVKFGALQDVSLEFSATSKSLYGQYQFPLAIARGTAKITAKAKFGQIQGRLFSDLFFGTALSVGQTATANGEAALVPQAEPFTVTVANAAVFSTDLGVIDAATGQALEKVANAPGTGQYTVAGGVYTLAGADAGKALLVSYAYAVPGGGQTMVYTNQLLGVQPVFRATLETAYTSSNGPKKAVLSLNACVSSKLSAATKHEDFAIPELDFECFADAAGNVFSWSFSEVS